MLDQNTKRKIDNTRQVLVGKVPDPKAQVEQITTALVYKFMDDMDKEAQELGGEARFFANGFSQFAWTKLLDQKLSGQERLDLYVQAITGMSNNQNIPQLFRDIFKGAFLPYNDPRTLSLFLKEINEFTYEHSEELGNSFEYLLSILGSQGDAGQFRTPRHIIDFIVEVVDPKKNEKILDPACGTAGFLISAFKHIIKQNKEKLLTPDEKIKLMSNLAGYDISPDMVKLALVNMYLHGFPEPKIYEYDTLSDERRWDENADVILANPPFMTPKGGIQPHKRFSIQANRSEILFVDYMAEHLSQNGRAGIIVPEGIIFQSAGAYKQLRKYLVENNLLWAVVSLPAGVFNPYSGVKTSILFLDKLLSKKTDKVLFLKVEADGFDLGAQRREIENSDLPETLKLIRQYKEAVLTGKDFLLDNRKVLLVEKSQISKKDDFNLSIDRYRFNDDVKQSHYELIKLEEVAKIIRGITFGKNEQLEVETRDSIRVATTKASQEHGIVENSLYFIPKKLIKDDEKILREGDILISTANSLNLLGRTTFVSNLNYKCTFGAFMSLIRVKQDKILPIFLFHCLRTNQAKYYFEVNANTTTNISNLSNTALYDFEIPLPPLEIQQQIVSKIEGYQKIINGAKQVVESYKPEIEIKEEWEMVELGSVCEIFGGGTPSKAIDKFWKNGNIKWISSKYINDDGIIIGYDLITPEAISNSSTKIAPKGSTILITRVSVGKSAYADDNYAINQDLTALVPNENKIDKDFLFNCSKVFAKEVDRNAQGIGVRGVTRDFVSELKIPLPSLYEQQEIVIRMEQEKQIINGNRKLSVIYQQKIKDEINKLWNADLESEVD